SLAKSRRARAFAGGARGAPRHPDHRRRFFLPDTDRAKHRSSRSARGAGRGDGARRRASLRAAAATADAPRNQGSASAPRRPRRGVARPAAMAALNDKIQSALDEARILVLGTQMLIGFEYRIVLEPAFERLPEISRWLALASLLLILLTFGLLLAPGSFHRI